jgi:hypothetical protein
MPYIIIFSIALAFSISFIVNDYLFISFEINHYIGLIFIPSGIRIFCTLVFDLLGAIGIVLGSLLISLIYKQEPSLLISLSTALIAGVAALAARWFSVDLLKLDGNLSRISFLELVQVCIIFAAISAISHQVFFYGLGLTQDFVLASLSMFAGDVIGALLCILFFRYAVLFVRMKPY